jgi:hypothetical protein
MCLLTYSMEQSSLRRYPVYEACHEISHILWNPKVHYRTHKCPSPVSILCRLYSVPRTLSNFLKIHLNVILQSTSWSPQWPLSLRFSYQHPVHTTLLSPYAPHGQPISFFLIVTMNKFDGPCVMYVTSMAQHKHKNVFHLFMDPHSSAVQC